MSEIQRPGPSGTPGPTFVPVPEIADALGLAVTQVHQMLRDRTLIASRHDGVAKIPAEFVLDGAVVKGLTGTITLLTDAGYRDDEILRWLFTGGDAATDAQQDSAVTLLRRGRARAVHRRAQIAGF